MVDGTIMQGTPTALERGTHVEVLVVPGFRDHLSCLILQDPNHYRRRSTPTRFHPLRCSGHGALLPTVLLQLTTVWCGTARRLQYLKDRHPRGMH